MRKVRRRDGGSVSRAEAAERLERMAASLRSGLIDTGDVQARTPDRVECDVTLTEGQLAVTVAWVPGERTRPETPAAEKRLDDTGNAAVARAEAHEAGQVRIADEAVVRDAREGRMP